MNAIDKNIGTPFSRVKRLTLGKEEALVICPQEKIDNFGSKGFNQIVVCESGEVIAYMNPKGSTSSKAAKAKLKYHHDGDSRACIINI